MARESIGIGAPFRWLQQALALVRRHPRPLAGATAILMAVALLPSVLQLALMAALPGASNAAWIQGLGFALSLLVYPPAVGGFYRVVHALETGRETAPAAVLELYGDGPAMRRMIIVNLLFVSLSLLLVSLLAWGFGGEELLQFLREVSQLKPGAASLPPVPPGLLPLAATLALAAVALVSAKGLASTECALGPRPPLAASLAALLATARNFGALLLFFMALAVLGFIAFMLVALAAVLAGMLLALISPVLATIVVLPLSLLLVLAMYALLFTFFYYGWRELFDTPPPPPAQTHQLAA